MVHGFDAVYNFRSLLHTCAIDFWADVHLYSNSSGQVQNRGNWWMRVAFSWLRSACGRAGKPFHPLGVQRFNISSPKMTSLANFTARMVILHSFLSSAYFCKTSGILFQLCFVNLRGSQFLKYRVHSSNWWRQWFGRFFFLFCFVSMFVSMVGKAWRFLEVFGVVCGDGMISVSSCRSPHHRLSEELRSSWFLYMDACSPASSCVTLMASRRLILCVEKMKCFREDS